jgi:topoisomerase (DNA) II binding protein 1
MELNNPLNDYKICLTGVTSTEERKASKLILQLGGKFSSNLTKDVFCLLVKKVGSKKYQVATELKIPTLEIQWLLDCYTIKSFVCIDSYKTKPFTGLSFSITGFQPEDRKYMQQQIIENGGINCDKMTRDNCTHLIALTAGSEKYNAAKVWNTIHVVNRKWLEDCISRQSWLPEVPYMVLPDQMRDPAEEEVEKERILQLKRLYVHTF